MALSLTAAQIEELLGALEAELRRRGIEGRIFLVGGAAMALAYNAGRSTGDLDGVLRPRDEVLDAAHTVATERGLPRTGCPTESPRHTCRRTPTTIPSPAVSDLLSIEIASPSTSSR
ncbi:hypothetical protein [Tsukamurella sp. PLM1]|uniref:hypothetical protein n=1 Tax=Tsukamurella sp. PLM1 TaxID=2929795 RepID=UPI002058BCCB|nr:hypothetical protein [Tsukamurella sp. PLM1]BDH55788.1 hypothetical protein MTP03_07270 [Tsukamurella sp. PLM1]